MTDNPFDAWKRSRLAQIEAYKKLSPRIRKMHVAHGAWDATGQTKCATCKLFYSWEYSRGKFIPACNLAGEHRIRWNPTWPACAKYVDGTLPPQAPGKAQDENR